MTVFHLHSSDDLNTLPLTKINTDWHGDPIPAAPSFAFGIDDHFLHFRATRSAPSTVHPSARPGMFQPELWKFDVAEFFLLNPTTNHYLEINLAPNGAWWSCLFTAPRVPLPDQEQHILDLRRSANHTPEHWDVSIHIPLAHLRKSLNFSPSCRLHAAFLLDSPQRCLTSSSPLPIEPDFHHPDLPTPIKIDSPPPSS